MGIVFVTVYSNPKGNLIEPGYDPKYTQLEQFDFFESWVSTVNSIMLLLALNSGRKLINLWPAPLQHNFALETFKFLNNHTYNFSRLQIINEGRLVIIQTIY